MSSMEEAIIEKCMDCSCDVKKEVELCFADDCALYPYRLGANTPKINSVKNSE